MPNGSISIDSAGEASGSGLSYALFLDYSAKIALGGVTGTKLQAAKQQLADLCQSIADVVGGSQLVCQTKTGNWGTIPAGQISYVDIAVTGVTIDWQVVASFQLLPAGISLSYQTINTLEGLWARIALTNASAAQIVVGTREVRLTLIPPAP